MDTSPIGTSISRRGWIAFGCLAVLALPGLTVMSHSGVLGEAVFHLVAGGFYYVSRTLPQVRVDGVTLFNSVLGLVIVCVVLHLLLRGFVMQKGKGTWRWRWTFSLMAMLAVSFGTCVATLGLVHHGRSVMAEPAVGAYPENASYARLISLASHEFAVENDGSWPRTVAALFVPPLLEPSSFLRVGVFAVSVRPDVPEPWIILGGPPPSGHSDIPLVAAPRPDPDGARLVVFHNGQAKNLRGDEWQAALVRWRLASAETKKPEGVKRQW